ncbi:hypothetical protein RRG08_055306 [Elysia crispata]|uniref:Uncharacterized protein n=1 Tax=Elysia crispata TaxID=231223 RepID=A0AAE1AQE6_9GAST|nr:hypothetical protein RRG08_055306 [Elysia crispata]
MNRKIEREQKKMCRLVIKERVGRGERKSGRSEVDRWSLPQRVVSTRRDHVPHRGVSDRYSPPVKEYACLFRKDKTNQQDKKERRSEGTAYDCTNRLGLAYVSSAV